MTDNLRRLIVALLTAAVAAPVAFAQDGEEAPSELGAEKIEIPDRPPVIVTVHMKLDGDAKPTAENIAYALFPSGRRCAFTYTGATSFKTIEVLSQLGYRTTMYCSPASSTEHIADLEASGADVGIAVWGAKPTYSSTLGANTIQEAFDAVVTSRMVMKKKAEKPLLAGSIGGHYSIASFPIDRNPDRGSGFGYAYHDSNFLVLSDNKPYMTYLGRQRETLLAHRENFDNRIESGRVPNETIYYQILANQFRGTLRRAKTGQICRFSLRDFKTPDLAEVKFVLGEYGRHPQIWHATESMIGANEYVRNKVKVTQVTPAGDGVDVRLAVERDVFPPFLLTALPLQLPKTVKAVSAAVGGVECPVSAGEDGPVVDVPLGAILADGVKMRLQTSAPDMTIPDEMPVTLTIANNTDKPIAGAKLDWVGNIQFTVTGGEGKAFDIPANDAVTINAVARNVKGARFGFVPFQAVVAAPDGRTWMEGFEIVVAPRLRVEMDPMQSIPLPAGRWQYFLVHVDNKLSTRPDGPPDTFVSHKTGPCKGTVGWDLPEGMKAEPAELPFELGANETKTLAFKVLNTKYSAAKGEMVKPVIRFAGQTEPVHVLFPGTIVIRDEARVAPKAVDDTGLLVFAPWDDNTKNGAFAKSVGNPSPHFFPGHTAAYHNEGVKGWCMNTQRVCQIHDPYRNIDYWEGTAAFWLRKDPMVRNENTFVPDPAETVKMVTGRNNSGESLLLAGNVQNAGPSNSGLALRRFRSWKGKPGYLQLTYQMMDRKLVVCRYEPFEWDETWRHLAILWSVPQKRLELYVDGKLAAKADAGKDPWMPSPWDRGRPSGWALQVITSDHGNWTSTCRDEVYIYNRALTPEQIAANMAAAKKK